ncbi:MAG: hypothetical protein IH899_03565 [Planctomycetes bacterium]|nr:hypothetical protein [Planctomycetota bacterium]
MASAWTGLRKAWGDGARRLPSGRKLRLTLRAVDEGVILVDDMTGQAYEQIVEQIRTVTDPRGFPTGTVLSQ